jgi:hypothetical protein
LDRPHLQRAEIREHPKIFDEFVAIFSRLEIAKRKTDFPANGARFLGK